VSLKCQLQVPAKPLLPQIKSKDVGKICVVIDLDETLVHSSFKVSRFVEPSFFLSLYLAVGVKLYVVGSSTNHIMAMWYSWLNVIDRHLTPSRAFTSQTLKLKCVKMFSPVRAWRENSPKKEKSLSSFTRPCHSKMVWLISFCKIQKCFEMFQCLYNDSQWPLYGAKTLKRLFKMYALQKKNIQILNNMRVRKWWQNFHFWVICYFNMLRQL